MLPIRTFATVAALCALPSLAQSQLAAAHMKFGVLAGTSIATISDAEKAIGDVAGALLDTKHRVGFDGGIFVNIPLSGMLSLQPEAHYSQKGVTFTAPSSIVTSQTAEVNVKIDYVEVPVLLRLDLGAPSLPFRPTLVAGASGAYRLSCKVAFASGATTATTDCSADEDSFTKEDFGVVGGGGLAMKLAGTELWLQLRYSQGLKNIAKKNIDTNGTKPKNSALTVLLGLSF